MSWDYESVTYTDENGDEQNCAAYLMQHGNLGVPGGVWGGDTRGCVPYAIALFLVHVDSSGEATVECLDGCMSDVVNNADSVAYALDDSRHCIPAEFYADWWLAEYSERADEYAAWAYAE